MIVPLLFFCSYLMKNALLSLLIVVLLLGILTEARRRNNNHKGEGLNKYGNPIGTGRSGVPIQARGDNYYRSESRNTAKDIDRRKHEFQEDQHNLHSNRPSGQFSREGHEQQIYNQERHMEKISREHEQCQREGRCGR